MEAGGGDEVPRGDLERMSEELARAMACPLKGADPDTDEPTGIPIQLSSSVCGEGCGLGGQTEWCITRSSRS